MNPDTLIKAKALGIKILTPTCRESEVFPLWHKCAQAVEASNYRVSSAFYIRGDTVCPFVKWVWDSVLHNLWLLCDILGAGNIYKNRKNWDLRSSLEDSSIYSLQNDIFARTFCIITLLFVQISSGGSRPIERERELRGDLPSQGSAPALALLSRQLQSRYHLIPLLCAAACV